MTAAAEAATHIQALAAPGRSVKDAIREAAIKAGFPYGLAKRLWYGEVRRVDSEVMDRLREAAKDAAALKEASDEFRTVLDRLARCEAALATLGLPGADRGGEVAAAPGAPRGGAHRALDQRGE